jgi:hypothetical protein
MQKRGDSPPLESLRKAGVLRVRGIEWVRLHADLVILGRLTLALAQAANLRLQAQALRD